MSWVVAIFHCINYFDFEFVILRHHLVFLSPRGNLKKCGLFVELVMSYHKECLPLYL